MIFYTLIVACLIISLTSANVMKPKIFKASPFITSRNSHYGPMIEGASVNKAGEAFATDFANKTYQIGYITPKQKLYHASPKTSRRFNGVRFLPLSKDDIKSGIKSIALATDLNNDEVVKITEMKDGTTKEVTFCKDESFVYSNDLTISKTGRVYVSGFDFVTGFGGGIWLCYPDGKVIQLGTLRSNGIELSPDEKFLYVSDEAINEFYKSKIWKFSVDPETGSLSSQELFADLEKLDVTRSEIVDGMRTDVEGNLYVSRYGGGKEVLIFSPNKQLIGRIETSITNVTNLEFTGKEGKTMYILGACTDDKNKGCVNKFESKIPGKAFTVLNSS
jgi:gluconolactonase